VYKIRSALLHLFHIYRGGPNTQYSENDYMILTMLPLSVVEIVLLVLSSKFHASSVVMCLVNDEGCYNSCND